MIMRAALRARDGDARLARRAPKARAGDELRAKIFTDLEEARSSYTMAVSLFDDGCEPRELRVAILCNHQKATSANHADQIKKMDDNIEKIRGELKEAKKAKSPKAEAIQKRLDKAEAARRTKDETKNVSLGTSKINYNDPRITIAWCKQGEVPPPTVYTRALVEKFNWAMEVEPSFDF